MYDGNFLINKDYDNKMKLDNLYKFYDNNFNPDKITIISKDKNLNIYLITNEYLIYNASNPSDLLNNELNVLNLELSYKNEIQF